MIRFDPDPPIKRFAQRHTAHNTDAIAARDLGLAIVRQSSSGHQMSTNALVRNDTAQSIMPSNSQESNNNGAPRNSQPGPQHGGGGGGGAAYKRPASPDYKRGRDVDAAGHGKRARSPSARDRDRWGDGHTGRRRYASPSWDRDRERDVGPPGGAARRPIVRDAPMVQEEEKPVVLPGVLSWFIGSLPPANKFDGQYSEHFRYVALDAYSEVSLI